MTYTLFLFIFCYVVPMICIIFFYSRIVRAVWAHEAAMRAQAKKMNVESLRQGDATEESAEMKIAKARTGAVE